MPTCSAVSDEPNNLFSCCIIHLAGFTCFRPESVKLQKLFRVEIDVEVGENGIFFP